MQKEKNKLSQQNKITRINRDFFSVEQKQTENTISSFRGGCVVQAIERRHADELWAVSDARKGGAPDGLGYKH
ncbi:unnamed protein product, partial [Rotaria sp. Silwood2]